MLTESIKDKVLDYLKVYTKADDWSVIHPGIVSRHSIVYRCVSPCFSSDLALKVYSIKSPVRIKSQYNAIENFYNLNKGDNCKYRMPKPYGLFEVDGFYVMEWVPGKALSDILWKNCFFKGRLQKNIQKSYKWLKHYHSSANLRIKDIDFLKYSKSIESHIKRRGSQDFFNDNLVFKAGFETLQAFAGNFIGYETYHANLHGDLNLGNIIINEKNIIGIDAGAGAHLPIQNDIAQMLTHICTNYFLMLPRSDMHDEMPKWEIFNVVLDAYNYSDDKKAREFFLFVFLHQLLQRWIATQYFHKKNENHTSTHFLLGKWRMYNCSVIVEGLTKVINERYLK